MSDLTTFALSSLVFPWQSPVDCKYVQWVKCEVVGNGYEEPYRPLIARINEEYHKKTGKPKYNAAFSIAYELDKTKDPHGPSPYEFCLVRIDSDEPMTIDPADVIEMMDADDKWNSLFTERPKLKLRMATRSMVGSDLEFDEVMRAIVVDPEDTREFNKEAFTGIELGALDVHDPVETRYFLNNGTTVTVHGLTLSNLSTTSPTQVVCYMNANAATGSNTGNICANVFIRSNTGGSGANTQIGTNVGASGIAANAALAYYTATWTPASSTSLNANDAVIVNVKVNAAATFSNKAWITQAFTSAVSIPTDTWTFNYRYAFNVNAGNTRIRFSYGNSTTLSKISNFTWYQLQAAVNRNLSSSFRLTNVPDSKASGTQSFTIRKASSKAVSSSFGIISTLTSSKASGTQSLTIRKSSRVLPLAGWQYRQKHQVNAATSAGSNYAVKILIHSGSGTSTTDDVYLQNHCTSFPNDITFTASDGITQLSFWIEDTTADPVVAWVKVTDDLSSVNRDIYIYYGKTGQSSLIDGANTFVKFTDFRALSSLPGDWTSTGSISYTVNNSLYVYPSGATSGGEVRNNSTVTMPNYAVRFNGKIASTSASSGGYYFSCFGFETAGFGGGYGTAGGFVETTATVFSTKYRELTVNASTATESADTAITNNTQAIWEVRVISGHAYLMKDDSQLLDQTTNVPTGAQYVGSWIQTQGGVQYVYWVCVRPFVSPEPANSTWYDEQWDGSPGLSSSLRINAGSKALSASFSVYQTWKDLSSSFNVRQSLQFYIGKIIAMNTFGDTDASWMGYLLNLCTQAQFNSILQTLSGYSDYGHCTEYMRQLSAYKRLGLTSTTVDGYTQTVLDNFPFLGSTKTPYTYNDGSQWFLVYTRYVLRTGFGEAKRLSYNTAKWNPVTALSDIDGLVDDYNYGIFALNPSTSAVAPGSGRTYDEDCETLDMYNQLYEHDKVNNLTNWQYARDTLWPYIYNNQYFTDHFGYTTGDTGYECEGHGIAFIIAKLRALNGYSLTNWSYVTSDIHNRFLVDGWDSPNWSHGTTRYYCTVHHHSTNSQRRLSDTLDSYYLLHAAYRFLQTSDKTAFADMITGNGDTLAWRGLIETSTLFDSSAWSFKPTSGDGATLSATQAGLLTLFLLGIVPDTGSMYVPIYETGYLAAGYNEGNGFDDYFSFDHANRTIKIPLRVGNIKFIYGTTPVTQAITTSGVYTIVFASDWNSITSCTKTGTVDESRLFFDFEGDASKALSSSFQINVPGTDASKDLSSSFTNRKSGSKALSSSFTIRKSSSIALSSSFAIRRTSAEALSSSFTCRKASTSTLSSSITLQKASSNALSSSFVIQRDSTKTLSSSLIVPRATVCINFDDGWTSVYDLALPEMYTRNIMGTVAVITNDIGSANHMTSAQLQTLQGRYNWGMESHTKTHTDLTTLTDEQIATECADSLSALQALGFSPTLLVPPYNAWSQQVVSVVAKYYKYMRGNSVGSAFPTYPTYVPYAFTFYTVTNTTTVADVQSKIELAIANGQLLVLNFHQIVTENADVDTKVLLSDFTQMLDYINTRRSAIKPSTVASAFTNILVGSELVSNNSFENLTGGWADSWSRTDTGGTITIDTGSLGCTPSITNTLKIDVNNPGTAKNAWTTNYITVDPVKAYLLRLYVRMEAYTSGTFQVQMEQYNSSNTYLASSILGTVTALFKGSKVYKYLPTRSDVAKIKIYIRSSVSSGVFTCYVDEVSSYELGFSFSSPEYDSLSSSITLPTPASNDESSSFTIRKSSSKAGSSSFTISKASSEALSSSLTCRKSGSKALSSSLTVQKASSNYARSSFTIRRASAKQLSSSFTIEKTSTRAISSSFTIQKSSSKALSASLTIRKASTRAISSSFTVSKSNYKQLSSSITLRNSGNKAQSSSFTIQKASSKALPTSVTVSKSASTATSSSFTIRKVSTKALSSSVTLRKVSTIAISSTFTVRKSGSTPAGWVNPQFKSDFEPNDFSEWTGALDNGTDASVVTTWAHHGTHSASFTQTANGAYYILYKAVATMTEVYGRCYIRFTNLPTGANFHWLPIAVANNTNGGISYVGLQLVGGHLYWGITHYKGGAVLHLEATPSDPVVDTDYCVEMYVKIDNAAGAKKLWINGNSRVDVGSLDTNDRGSIDRVRAILWLNATEAASVTFRSDCYVFSNSYIGPEDWSQASFTIQKASTKYSSSSFTIRKASSNALSSSFYVRTELSTNLSSSFQVTRPATKTLSSSFTIERSASKELSSSLTIRRSSSKDVSSSFTIERSSSKDVSSSWTIEKSSSKDSSSSFTIQKASSKDLSASVTIEKSAFKDLSSSFTIRKSATKALSSSFTIENTSSKDLSSSFTIRRASSKALSSSFNVYHTGTLSGSKALSSSFTVRNIGSKTVSSSITLRKTSSRAESSSFSIQKSGSTLMQDSNPEFQEDFENNNLDRWTASSGTPTIETLHPHHGTYDLVIDANNEWVSKTLSSSHSAFYYRTVLQFGADCGDNNDDRLLLLGTWNIATANYVTALGRRNVSGVKKWRLYAIEGGVRSDVAYSTTPTFTVGQKYTLEILSIVNATQGEHHVWIDGVEITDLSRTGKDTSTGGGNVNRLILGPTAVYGAIPSLFYDCVVANSHYIGPEDGLNTSFSIQKTSSKTLSSSFTIQKASSKYDSSSFTIRKASTKQLSSSFTIERSSSKAVSSSFTILKSSSKAISSSFTVEKASSTAMSSSLTIQKSASKALSSSLTIEKASSKNVSSSFTIRKSAAKALSSSLTIEKSSSKDVSSSLTIRKASTRAESSSFTIRKATTVALSSSVTIQKASTKALSSSFAIQRSGSFHPSIHNDFTIRKSSSKALSSSFYVSRPSMGYLACSITLRKSSLTQVSSSFHVTLSKKISSSFTIRRSAYSTLYSSITLRKSGSRAVSSSFTCRKASNKALSSSFGLRSELAVNLSSSITLRKSTSKDLSSSVTLRKASNKTASSSFTIRKASSVVLSSSFTCRKASSKALSCSVSLQKATAHSLSSSFSIEKSSSVALSGSFTIQKSGSFHPSIHWDFTVRNVGYKQLLSSFMLQGGQFARLTASITIRNVSYGRSSSSFTIRRASSKAVSSSFTCRKSSSRDLSSSITLQKASFRDLTSSLTLQKSSSKALNSSVTLQKTSTKALSSSFTCRKSASKALSSSLTFYHGSANLRSSIAIGGSQSTNIRSSVTIRNQATKALSSSFTIGRLASKASSTTSFTIRKSYQRICRSSITIRKQASASAHSSFSIRRTSSAQTSTQSFSIRKASSKKLSSNFTVRKSSSKNEPESFSIQRSWQYNLPANLALRFTGVENLSEEFAIRNIGSFGLNTSFSVRTSWDVDASSSFSVQRSAYVEEPSNVTVYNTGSVNLSCGVIVNPLWSSMPSSFCYRRRVKYAKLTTVGVVRSEVSVKER
jgi:hypothetical protein